MLSRTEWGRFRPIDGCSLHRGNDLCNRVHHHSDLRTYQKKEGYSETSFSTSTMARPGNSSAAAEYRSNSKPTTGTADRDQGDREGEVQVLRNIDRLHSPGLPQVRGSQDLDSFANLLASSVVVLPEILKDLSGCFHVPFRRNS